MARDAWDAGLPSYVFALAMRSTSMATAGLSIRPLGHQWSQTDYELRDRESIE